MTNEILFRGKRIDTGEWVEGTVEFHLIDGDLTKKDKKAFITFEEMDSIGKVYRFTFEVDPKTVGQYTNMWDGFGNGIYAGDIVAYNNTNYCVGIIYGAFVLERIDDDLIDYEDFPQNTFPCGCDETEFMGVCHDYLVSLFELSSNEQDFEGALSCKVIGNRWDNPELLEINNE